jgi:hypothetical protein
MKPWLHERPVGARGADAEIAYKMDWLVACSTLPGLMNCRSLQQEAAAMTLRYARPEVLL